MKNKLTKQQRHQALGWCSVMGFSAGDLADHFGLTPNEMAKELAIERKSRSRAGKSPEPVPVVRTPAGRQLTYAMALAESLTALQAIVRIGEREVTAGYRNKLSVYTARTALEKVGFLP